MSDEFYWIAVAAVAVLSAARLTRLVVVDKFPPIVWFRDKYADRTDGSGWDLLLVCAYCTGFWVTLGVVLWGWLTDFDESWWVVNAVLAASYLSALVVVRDVEAA